MKTVSVIINNFNYADYLQQAIESVLNQSFQDFELIIVDDGSTDDSIKIISKYSSFLSLFTTSNKGQNAACNLGFSKSHGRFVLFLDSDDYLKPDCLKECLDILLQNKHIKAQFYLQRVSFNGTPLQGQMPPFSMGNEKTIRNHMNFYGYYPTPPTSGNMFARNYLESLFPIPSASHIPSFRVCPIDGLLSGVAGFYPSKIAIINKVLGFYRIHNRNYSNHNGEFDLNKIRTLFMWDSHREFYQMLHAKKKGFLFRCDLSRLSPMVCKQRLLSIRFDKNDHPIKTDSRLSLFLSGLYGAMHNPYLDFQKRIFVFFGFFFISFIPLFILRRFSRFILKTK